jgi:hypothetical protein
VELEQKFRWGGRQRGERRTDRPQEVAAQQARRRMAELTLSVSPLSGVAARSLTARVRRRTPGRGRENADGRMARLDWGIRGWGLPPGPARLGLLGLFSLPESFFLVPLPVLCSTRRMMDTAAPSLPPAGGEEDIETERY